MDSNQLNQGEADFKHLKELFPDIDSEMIAFFYSEHKCSLENTMNYLLTHVPQTNSLATPKDSSTSTNSDELMAKAMQEILARNEELTPENIEKEIQKLSCVDAKKEDVSRDELVAQAIQTLLNRNEEISESNIEKEIQQIQNDILLAHQIQFGGHNRSSNSQKQLKKEQSRLFNEMAKEIEKPSEIAVGIENFFRDVGEGIKSTVASITEFVEAKLDEKNDEVVANSDERLKLLADKDVELDEISLATSRNSRDVDLDESFLDENLKEPIGLVSLKTGSLVFRESSGD